MNDTRAERKTILVSAYGCEPFRGSEAGVGWNWILQMARTCDLHVLARSNDQQKIEENLPERLRGCICFHYYDCSKLLKRIKRGEKGLYFYYFCWQLGVFRVARDVLAKHHIDYTMHLTFGSFWMPTFLPLLDVPFIWGPLGGGVGVPTSLLGSLPPRQRVVQGLRAVLVKTSRLNPVVAFPSKQAVQILCRTRNDVEAVPAKYRDKTLIVLETAIEEQILMSYESQRAAPLKAKSECNVVVSGRLVASKNVAMAVRAFAATFEATGEGYLTVLGDGPERDSLLALSNALGVDERVCFRGRLSREQVLEELRRSDILLFPSLKEGGSWSLMEGMALGLPTICLDWSGMQMIVDRDSGILVRPASYEKTLEDFTRALVELVTNHDRRIALGEYARQRVLHEFGWDRKGEFFEQLIYGGVTGVEDYTCEF